jgi:ribosomal protein S18 acetylase RimI-like enzyme
MEDVVTGHKGTGHFNPALWFLALRDEQPLGVLLLSPTADGDAMELVYLGLVPHARGQRLGDFFMRHALAATARAGCARLTLAVDAANAPALRLYYRHAMKRVTTKVAMMLDVRKKQDER